MGKPLYGVDGNLLVADLPYNLEAAEAILDGTFKPEFWAQQFLPVALMLRYPHLREEIRERLWDPPAATESDPCET